MSDKIPVNKKPASPKVPKIPPQAKAPVKETIYVDVDDEITSIIDKVEAAKAQVVALVLPKRANALQSVVNMRLLKRSAENASKNLVLVTGEAALLPLAGAVGLHVAKNLQSAPEIPPSPIEAAEAEDTAPSNLESIEAEDINPEDAASKIDYKKSIGELAAAHGLDDTIELKDSEDELPMPKEPKSSAGPQAMSKKLKVPNFERFRLILFGGIALLIGFIMFIIFAILVLPKGTVTISTTSMPVSANLTLDASDKYTTVDEVKNQIPAALKATKQTANQTVNATGQQNLGVKATGSVTMTARECYPDLTPPVSINAGTGVSTAGLTFITQTTTKFSNSGVVTGTGTNACATYQATGPTNITAQSGGTKYNVSGASFTVSGRSDASATGSASGGTDNNVTVVSQADVDGAKSKVTSANSDSFIKTFEKQLADQGYYVLTSTLKLGDPVVTSTPAIGTQASSAAVNVEVTYSVLAVKKDDLRKIISDALTKQVDKSKQKLSNDDVLKGASISVQNQTAPAAAILSVSEDTTAVPIINISQVKTLANNKKGGDIKTAISAWPGVKNVEVKFSPFWVTKVKDSKITVKLVQVKD